MAAVERAGNATVAAATERNARPHRAAPRCARAPARLGTPPTCRWRDVLSRERRGTGSGRQGKPGGLGRLAAGRRRGPRREKAGAPAGSLDDHPL